MGTLCVVLIGGAMLSKSLIQFYVNGWGWVPSLLFDLRPNYGAGNEDSSVQFSRSVVSNSLHEVAKESHFQPQHQSFQGALRTDLL